MIVNTALQAFAAPSVTVKENANSADIGFDAKAMQEAATEAFKLSQTKKTSETTKETVIAAFQDYMNKTPAERMRAQILGEMGITEEELAALPPEERRKIEEKITAMMRERFEEQTRKQMEKSAGLTKPTGSISMPTETYASILSAEHSAAADKSNPLFAKTDDKSDLS